MATATPEKAINKTPIDKIVCFCQKTRTNEFMEKATQHQVFTVDKARDVIGVNMGCGACYETVEALVAQVKASSEV